jgi:hypothetical protein
MIRCVLQSGSDFLGKHLDNYSVGHLAGLDVFKTLHQPAIVPEVEPACERLKLKDVLEHVLILFELVAQRHAERLLRLLIV